MAISPLAKIFANANSKNLITLLCLCQSDEISPYPVTLSITKCSSLLWARPNALAYFGCVQ